MSTRETTRYFEDWAVGETVEVGSETVTEAAILEFAREFDPQPYHVDPAAAEETIFGGLVASGWHTAAVCMRLFVEEVLADVAVAGGRGVDDLRWHRPVRPGDELVVRAEVVEKRPSEDLPGLGDLHTRIEGVDPDGEPVVSFTLWGLVEQRFTEA